VESFESYRPYLFSIAYRMLGSAMDAEDMVQETYLRSQTTPPETIRSLKAFLTTILTRLCVDQLQLARRKREVYVGVLATWVICSRKRRLQNDLTSPPFLQRNVR
jgi:RNA polymerase sigma-70 factor (ECF subfamily)